MKAHVKEKLQESFLNAMFTMPEEVFLDYVISYCITNNWDLDILLQKLIKRKEEKENV